MNIELPVQLEEFVNRSVETGKFDSASQAVSAGLMLLMDYEEDEEELERLAKEGLKSLKIEGPLDGEAVMARIKDRISARMK